MFVPVHDSHQDVQTFPSFFEAKKECRENKTVVQVNTKALKLTSCGQNSNFV